MKGWNKWRRWVGGVVYQIGRIGKRKTQPSYAKLCIRLYETKSRKEKNGTFISA